MENKGQKNTIFQVREKKKELEKKLSKIALPLLRKFTEETDLGIVSLYLYSSEYSDGRGSCRTYHSVEVTVESL